ncbi:MAG: UbiX family flavin prenyltransferase [Pseudomonadota bacterium]
MKNKKHIIIGLTGASGSAYAVCALSLLQQEPDVEVHFVATKAGAMTLRYEADLGVDALADLADHHYAVGDVGAPIASGSFETIGMLIAPCSVKTMSEIATGVTDNLMARAADVVLKERRRLVLMVRETPFHLGHLRTMTALTEMGAIVAPPLPAFYAEPKSVDDLVAQSVRRSLDLFGLRLPGTRRWGVDLKKGARP